MSEQVNERPEKRIAIVGTAGTWKLTPWQDPNLQIWGLNDAYVLGFPRADAWFDLHPFSQMSFRPQGQRMVSSLDVPIGAYLRPEGHLEWLRTRPFPVYLREAQKDWPNSHTFPRAEIEQKFGSYFASTPAWMIAFAMEQGATSLEIYGIHLATEWEYIAQKPNMEFLLGIALARGLRVVIPNKAPLMKAKHVYAYEPKPDLPFDALNQKIDRIKMFGQKLHQQMAGLPWYARRQKIELQSRLAGLDLELSDVRQEQQRWRQSLSLM